MQIKKVLVANRGEIAIRILRALVELKMRTVAIYSYEDRYSLHRFKSDESYQIGSNNEPLKPYLDIDEIISLAKEKNVDAIHPGYGFLSENIEFASKCEENGMVWIGPRPEVMARLGDKVAAKKVAAENNIPVIQSSNKNLIDSKIALDEATRIGFPVILKAASGGGGRGMRIVHKPGDIENAYNEAQTLYDQALALSPDNYDVASRYVYFLYATKGMDAAQAYADSYMTLVGADSTYYAQMQQAIGYIKTLDQLNSATQDVTSDSTTTDTSAASDTTGSAK